MAKKTPTPAETKPAKAEKPATVKPEATGQGEVKKHPGGRPSTYRPEYADRLKEYFSTRPVTTEIIDGDRVEVKNPFPTLARYATDIGVHRETLLEWASKHPEFSDAYKAAKALQEANLVEGAMCGAYSQAFAIFTAKNVLGWRDKTEIDQTVTSESKVEHSGTVVVPGLAERLAKFDK